MGICGSKDASSSTKNKKSEPRSQEKQPAAQQPQDQKNKGQEQKSSEPPEEKLSNFGLTNEKRKQVSNVWDEYETIKKIGAGGYGKVVCVKEKNSKKQESYAMKLVERYRNGQDYGDRFWIEYDLLKKVGSYADHPQNLLSAVDAFYDDKHYYLVTEMLSGGELLDHILQEEKGSFSEKKASVIFSTMLQSLAFLHSKKIVHLDLKPENFVYSLKEIEATEQKPRLLKLIDFGCAREVSDKQICNVRTGTPYYIAPEMLTRKVEKNGSVLRACDMWSMGVILFVLVTGRLPFFGETRKDILQSVLNGKYQFPADVTLSEQVKDLISKLLEKDHLKRLSAHEALQHPWLTDVASLSEAPVSPTVLEGIRNCARDTRLKKALAALLVHDLTEEDKDNLKKMFQALDTDHNGVLQYKEIVCMVERFGYDKAQSARMAQRLVEEFDADQNGVIDLEEFAQIGTRGMLSINEQFVNQLFEYVDRDGNGFVSQAEIELYFSEQPNFKQEIDVLSLMHEADLNKDGVISRDEFLEAMRLRQNQ
jgi:calcium-dependent protein kinase